VDDQLVVTHASFACPCTLSLMRALKNGVSGEETPALA
jgi:hypothetical protein